ncbi:MAG: outer membrane beta-barrel protein [Myxococcota bacterium]
MAKLILISVCLCATLFAAPDFSWLNGNSRQTDFPLETKYFTGQFIFDANYVYDFASPADHSLVGSSNTGRTNELQVQQLGIGGDFHFKNVRGRLMTQFGLYSTMTPRSDPSPARGQWQLDDAYRYISEAYAGYHFDLWQGVNVDAGIFMSYIGLCSYYNYENWIYQMSYVSSNTPWYFNGVRIQAFPVEEIKLELWLINGWQSYGMFNQAPGAGAQISWRPGDRWALVTNNYFGYDTAGTPGRIRLHTDNSVQHKYYDNPNSWLSKAAFSLTADLGCESGGGIACGEQYFAGLMAYNRFWFWKDQLGLTLGTGAIKNPGRYLVVVPAINGATAASGTPYFSLKPGDDFWAWDASATFDYMPNQFLTLRLEYTHREASVPYFASTGGITPPGGNHGTPTTLIQNWEPDLSKSENRVNLALLVRF